MQTFTIVRIQEEEEGTEMETECRQGQNCVGLDNQLFKNSISELYLEHHSTT